MTNATRSRSTIWPHICYVLNFNAYMNNNTTCACAAIRGGVCPLNCSKCTGWVTPTALFQNIGQDNSVCTLTLDEIVNPTQH